MQGRLHLTFDFKAMGVNAYVPVAALIMIGVYSWMNVGYPSMFVPVMEYVVPTVACWWSIFLFRDVLEEAGSETLFTYSLPRWKLGIVRVIIFVAFYICMLVVMLAILDYRADYDLFLPLVLQLDIQSFFMAGLGFLAMMISAHAGGALLIPLGYMFFQILLPRPILPQLHILFHNDEVLDVRTVLHGSTNTVLVGILFYVVAQYMLYCFKRYR